MVCCYSTLSISLDSTNNLSEVQVKKHLTAEEHAMRRAEMARRRKNLSEKRNEEEKVRCSSFPLLILSFAQHYHLPCAFNRQLTAP